LEHGREVRVFWNVGHDFGGVGFKAGLKRFNGFAEDVAHGDVGRGHARSSTSKAFVHRVVLAVAAHATLHHRHVRVPIVIMVESSAGRIGVHYADFDHAFSPRTFGPFVGKGMVRRRVNRNIMQK